MKMNPTISLKEIAGLLSLSTRYVEKAVSRMVADGDIVHEGPRKGGIWKVLK
jgi:predicted HTH transcriptional regulator